MRDVVARLKRLAAPRSLKTSSVGPAAVTLKWTAPKGATPAYYVVLRDGKSLGKTTRRSYTDSKVKPGKVYRYTVRAYDKRKRAGALSASVRVKVPAAGHGADDRSRARRSHAAGSGPDAGPDAAGAASAPPTLSTAMVDRLFWRAGFGPTQAERDAWTGRPVDDLVDWFLEHPGRAGRDEHAAEDRPRARRSTRSCPTSSSSWSGSTACSGRSTRCPTGWRSSGTATGRSAATTARSRSDWALRYRNRLLRFADFGRYPTRRSARWPTR